VAEQVILKPIVEELLAPDVIAEMVTEMRTYYAQRMADAKAEKAKVPVEIAELDQRIARPRARLKAGDPDMAADDIAAVIEKVEARKAELMAAQPEAKQQAKALRALPAAAAAKQYRDQITKGFAGNVIEAGRARVAVRQLLGDQITLKPAKDRSHLVAHLQFSRAALLGAQFTDRRVVGSGGTLREFPTGYIASLISRKVAAWVEKIVGHVTSALRHPTPTERIDSFPPKSPTECRWIRNNRRN
jgi:hypothetical protein